MASSLACCSFRPRCLLTVRRHCVALRDGGSGGGLLITLALPVIGPWRADADGSTPAPLADAASGTTGEGTSVGWAVVASGLHNGVTRLAAVLAGVEPWAAPMWLATSAAVACVYAAGYGRLARRRREWTRAIVQGAPVLVATDTGPAIVGLASPIIVLPQWTRQLDETSLSIILRHEREHIAARDPWLVLATALATLLMPWNPAVWWMAARLRLAVEFDCDSRVLGSTAASPEDVARYGGLLLAVASRRDVVVPFAAPALIESSSSLSRRIAAMCASRVRFGRTKMIAAAVGALALLVAACGAPVPAEPAEQADRPGPIGPGPTAVSGAAMEVEREPAGAVQQPETNDRVSPEVQSAGRGVTNPRVLRDVRPAYTAAAMRAKVQGNVELEALVGVDGLVKDVRITKSLDTEFGLDEEAIKAARRWRFEPAVSDGKPVPKTVTLVLSFTIH
jgi:TonB family protein